MNDPQSVKKIKRHLLNARSPVCDDFQLFEDQENSAFNKKFLVLVQGFVQHQKVAGLHSLRDLGEL